ncbi:recombinase RecT [Mycoplasmatota bacterium]|nr:recombinase RecT [Mycoplasmatota bacterium]
MEKDIADIIFNRVNKMESTQQLMFPPNYAVGNALKSAYLIIQKTVDKNKCPALQVCTKESIANALLEMVVQGLNPVKTQCYFMVHGNSVDLFRSYFGDQIVVKNALMNVKEITATIIYKDDEIELDIDSTGKRRVKSHVTKFENIDKGIAGAYATIIFEDNSSDQEVMTMKEIQVSWDKSQTKTQSVQKEFPQEMAKRTVIKRLCKRHMNTSNDANLFIVESYNRTTENEFINTEPSNQIELQEEVDNTANQEQLIIEGEAEEIKAPTDSKPADHDESVSDDPGF